MAKALSADLRKRWSRRVRPAARRRSASSAIRWCALARLAGSVVSGPLGGDRRSLRMEAQTARILSFVKWKAGITLVEIQAKLAEAGVLAGTEAPGAFSTTTALRAKKAGARRRAASAQWPRCGTPRQP